MTTLSAMGYIEIAKITVPDQRERRAIDPASITELAASIERHGLLHAIAVDHDAAGGYTLISGERRLTACKQLGWTKIYATIYGGVSRNQSRMIEIEENLLRADLTPGERQAQTVTLLALVREVEEQAEPETRITSDFTPKPTTGRGHKGAVATVADRIGKDPKAVRQTIEAASATIGEVIDPKAPAAVLKEQAEKVREKAPTVPRRRQPAPAPQISRGAASALAKSMGPDLLVTMRALEVALPDGFDGARWFSGLPAFQQKGAVKTVRDLNQRLDLLFMAIVGEPADPAPAVDPIEAAGGKDIEPAAPEKPLSPTKQWERDHPDDKPCPRDPTAAKAWRVKRGLQEARGMHSKLVGKSRGAPKCGICGKVIRADQMDVVHEGKPAHFKCVTPTDKPSH